MSDFKQLESSQKDQKIVNKDKKNEQISYHDKKAHNSNIKKLRNKINKLEKEIASLSAGLKDKDKALSDPVKFQELSSDKDFFSKYDQDQQKLSVLEDDWAVSTEKLDQLIS
jgi:ATP-binding cassette subfamily F protein 3